MDVTNENWIEGFAKQAADLGLNEEQTKLLMTKASHLMLYNTSEAFREGFDKEAAGLGTALKGFFSRLNNFGRAAAPAAKSPSALRNLASGAGNLAAGGLKATGAILPSVPALVTGAGLFGGGQYLYNQGRDFLNTLHMDPMQAQWHKQMQELADSGMSPEQQVLAVDTLKKNIARTYANNARVFGHKDTRNAWEDRPAWMNG